ncbi:MAG: exodeoxyribonuclease VII small subunit [Paludibacteraceae bacterium]|nr:exodeoxyribonuclease VII small subunit [Paludibacteraceae bacterium]
MEKVNNYTYDEAIARAEAIIAGLEQAEAIGMDEYKKKAAEATSLLQYCKSLIAEMHQDIPV